MLQCVEFFFLCVGASDGSYHCHQELAYGESDKVSCYFTFLHLLQKINNVSGYNFVWFENAYQDEYFLKSTELLLSNKHG